MTIRVLFVRDGPAGREDLANSLHHLGTSWQLHFSASPAEALDLIDRQPVDAVIADVQMSATAGVSLLDQVRERFPAVLRYLLAGENSREGAMRALPVSHQVLTRPCDAGILERIIERDFALQQRLTSPGLRKTLGMLKSLPALPQSFQDLVRALDDPNSSSGSVASIIQRDVGMTARLLQIANSSLFSNGRNVRHVRDAVTLLGLVPIRSVVLTLELFKAMGQVCAPKGFSLSALQQHSMQTAQGAAAMLRDPEQKKTAYSAGMLHDVGQLLLAVGLPDQWSEANHRAMRDQRPLYEVETEVIGCNHAEIGGHMLALWGLPGNIVEAVAYHHQPSLSGETSFDVISAVHAANAMAHTGGKPLSDCPTIAVDLDYLGRVGGLDHLAQPAAGQACEAVS